MDKFIVIASLALVVVVFGLIGAVTFGSPVAPAEGQYTADNAITTARQFVNAENTFKFDGMTETLNVKMNKTVSASVFVIVAEFTSRHAGFGDRADKMVAEVLTPHTTVITVEKGTVVSALMDGQWDMIGQKTADTQTPPSDMSARYSENATWSNTPDDALR
jgi:hypothetical protein